MELELEDQVLEVEELQNNFGLFYTICSFIYFFITRELLRKCIPKSVSCQGRVTSWKWVNVSTSLIHSSMTGIGSLLCFFLHPEHYTNVVSSFSQLSHILACIALGYFFFDLIDMSMNHRKRSSYELMLHHFLAIICFAISVFTRYYLGFAMVSLLIEVNSILLHWRQLLILDGTPKSTNHYRVISIVNLITFLIFRICTLAWMMKWLAFNREKVPFKAYCMGCLSSGGVVIMSLVLFFRILKADFFSSDVDNEKNKKYI